MSRLAELQRQFLDYLLSRDAAFLEHVLDQGPVDRETRAEIYRKGYRLRLRDAIDTDHEMLGLYLGDDLFEQMVEGYIDWRPSTYTSLRHFAEDLPQYLRTHAPFSEHPLIAELAAFERMLLFAFDAADAERVTAAALPEMPAEHWPGMRVRFHPSVQLFVARFNSVESWQALKGGKAPPPAAEQPEVTWLLWRNGERVTEFRPLDASEQALFQAALTGMDFAGLCELLASWHMPEAVGAEALRLLEGWLEAGIVSRLAVG